MFGSDHGVHLVRRCHALAEGSSTLARCESTARPQTRRDPAGALGVALFYMIVQRVTRRNDLALTGALLLGGGYAYWYYAVEIEVYTVATLFLIICLDILTQPSWWRSRRSLLLLGLAQGGAVLFHQTNVLLCGPILVYAIYDLRLGKNREPRTENHPSGSRFLVLGSWLQRWSTCHLVILSKAYGCFASRNCHRYTSAPLD